jgi:hypothetical protein
MPLTPSDVRDLRWYFDEAAGELGVASSHGAMVARLAVTPNRGSKRGSLPTQATPATMDGHVSASARERRVRRRLDKLTSTQRRALELVHGPRSPRRPPPGEAVFAGLAALATMTDAAVRGHARALERVAKALGKVEPGSEVELRRRAAAAYPDLWTIDTWLAALVRKPKPDETDKAALALIRAEAKALIDGAEEAYAATRPPPASRRPAADPALLETLKSCR